MVLVDATDADTVMGRLVDGKYVDYRVRTESKGRPVPPVQTIQSSPPGPLTAEEQARFEQTRSPTITKSYSPHDRLPANLQALDVWFRNHPDPLRIRANYPFHAEEMQQLFEEQQGPEPPLGNKPLIVMIQEPAKRSVEGSGSSPIKPSREMSKRECRKLRRRGFRKTASTSGSRAVTRFTFTGLPG
jgi:hypothetical protein